MKAFFLDNYEKKSVFILVGGDLLDEEKVCRQILSINKVRQAQHIYMENVEDLKNKRIQSDLRKKEKKILIYDNWSQSNENTTPWKDENFLRLIMNGRSMNMCTLIKIKTFVPLPPLLRINVGIVFLCDENENENKPDDHELRKSFKIHPS